MHLCKLSLALSRTRRHPLPTPDRGRSTFHAECGVRGWHPLLRHEPVVWPWPKRAQGERCGSLHMCKATARLLLLVDGPPSKLWRTHRLSGGPVVAVRCPSRLAVPSIVIRSGMILYSQPRSGAGSFVRRWGSETILIQSFGQEVGG